MNGYLIGILSLIMVMLVYVIFMPFQPIVFSGIGIIALLSVGLAIKITRSTNNHKHDYESTNNNQKSD